jgi:DNA-binding helix-hairpin-helix protein with protein kinase domain
VDILVSRAWTNILDTVCVHRVLLLDRRKSRNRLDMLWNLRTCFYFLLDGLLSTETWNKQIRCQLTEARDAQLTEARDAQLTEARDAQLVDEKSRVHYASQSESLESESLDESSMVTFGSRTNDIQRSFK